MTEEIIEVTQDDMDTLRVISEFKKRKEFHEKQAIQINSSITGLESELILKYGEGILLENARLMVV